MCKLWSLRICFEGCADVFIFWSGYIIPGSSNFIRSPLEEYDINFWDLSACLNANVGLCLCIAHGSGAWAALTPRTSSPECFKPAQITIWNQPVSSNSIAFCWWKPSLQALRAETLVDGLPRANRFKGRKVELKFRFGDQNLMNFSKIVKSRDC